MILASFVFFLLLFTVVGIASIKHSRKNSADYLLAGRSVKPWLVGLSAVATNNSGYMFTGMIGFTYMAGLSSIWLMIGWVAGDFLGSMFIHQKMRMISEKNQVNSFGGVLSRWNGTDFRTFRRLAGAISFLFLGAYAAAQLKAGSKALHVLFGWDMAAGAVIGSVIVLLYCFSGGIRASIWTDAAQSFVMLFSMAALLFFSVQIIGGPEILIEKLEQVSPAYLGLFPENLPAGPFWGPFLFVLGWMFAGFGVVGQPHIMIRFMTIDDPNNMNKARYYYYGWFLLFYALTIGAGLAARVLLPETQNFDAELALPMLSQKLLPPLWVGLVLAGLFAATMSTADSLILSCSASLTHDFFPGRKISFLLTKGATLLVTLVALGIALSDTKSVFELVLYSWAVLAGAFGPLLIVYCLGQRPSELLAILMLAAGSLGVLLWKQWGLARYIYEIAPGMAAGLLVFIAGKFFGLMLPQTKITTPSE